MSLKYSRFLEGSSPSIAGGIIAPAEATAVNLKRKNTAFTEPLLVAEIEYRA